MVQIVHSRGDHWIVVSTNNGKVNVYDFANHNLDKVTMNTVHNLPNDFEPSNFSNNPPFPGKTINYCIPSI